MGNTSYYSNGNQTYTEQNPSPNGPGSPSNNSASPSSFYEDEGGVYEQITTNTNNASASAAAALASQQAAAASAAAAAASAASVPSAGNPTALVGLTAKNGTASTVLRTDGAPALDQSIVPTWTGLHNFTGGLQVTGVSVGPFATLAVGTSAQYVRADGTKQTLNAAAVAGLTAFATLATGTSAQYVRGDGVLATTPVGTVTSVAMTVPAGLVVAGSPISGSGTFAVSWSGTIPATSLPNPSATTLGGVQSIAAVASKWVNSISTAGVPSLTQPAFTDISGSVSAAQMPALTGDVTSTAGTVATTIAAGAVTFAKVASAAIATTAQYLNNTASEILSTDKVWGAAAPVTVTYGATVTLDFNTFVNAAMTFGAGNVTFANPSNVKAGQCGVIALTQDGTGSRTASWGANFHFPGGTAPTLSTAASALDLLGYFAVSTTYISVFMLAKGT